MIKVFVLHAQLIISLVQQSKNAQLLDVKNMMEMENALNAAKSLKLIPMGSAQL